METIWSIIDIVIHNLIGVSCIVYFIIRDYMLIKEMQKTMDEIMLRL